MKIMNVNEILQLYQGEERHTFYSNNTFTYQGDYNEISVAQVRYKTIFVIWHKIC